MNLPLLTHYGIVNLLEDYVKGGESANEAEIVIKQLTVEFNLLLKIYTQAKADKMQTISKNLEE